MPTAAPVYRPAGYRTADQRKRDLDKRRADDMGRLQRKQVYNSKAWAELRDLARGQDPFCVDCRLENKLVPWTDLDHKKDMAEGGEPLSLDNVEGRCHSHHSAKTSRTRGFHK